MDIQQNELRNPETRSAFADLKREKKQQQHFQLILIFLTSKVQQKKNLFSTSEYIVYCLVILTRKKEASEENSAGLCFGLAVEFWILTYGFCFEIPSTFPTELEFSALESVKDGFFRERLSSGRC